MEFFKIMKLLNKKFYMILLVFVGLIFSGAIFISTYPSPGDILDKIEEFISNPKQCASSNSDFSKAAKSIAWDSEEMIIIEEDRKSTRLNSSHSQISYAVFCLKKKIRYHIVL